MLGTVRGGAGLDFPVCVVREGVLEYGERGRRLCATELTGQGCRRRWGCRCVGFGLEWKAAGGRKRHGVVRFAGT